MTLCGQDQKEMVEMVVHIQFLLRNWMCFAVKTAVKTENCCPCVFLPPDTVDRFSEQKRVLQPPRKFAVMGGRQHFPLAHEIRFQCSCPMF